ncbi:cupin-like domain-containing protein [Polyangium aurulentum]|uniref:cupin-like domain-containing protein n=1 Tax=Polyangium aurulentum TaxID=2567896 RepID=UPI0010ADB6B9|nr:cupin-like domain-containing protein [Polyangium aurulentum]UQA61279.1 cupin-like domain-containing protein [Polyangium aurulentum]
MISRIHKAGARTIRRAPAREVIALSDDWRAWVVENALRGVSREGLVETLVDNGVPARIAYREVSEILASPAMAACVALDRRVQKLEMVARLGRVMAEQAPRPDEIERVHRIDADAFYAHHFAACRPLFLTGFTEGWPALGQWSPAHFKERFGEAEIEIMADRNAHPTPDRDPAAHRRKVRMADFVDMIAAAGATNDFYMVAHNHARENPALRPLFDDVRPPGDIFDPAPLMRASSLWLGPAGTLTPLHHDTTNVLFCQIYGKKRFWLVSPQETALLDRADGFYATVRATDLEAGRHPELGEVRVHRVDLAPGDSLFIPAGWWHEVLALEPSISFSLMNFRRPNDYSWYRPGSRS